MSSFSFKSEITGLQTFQSDTLLELLNSKRLLIDHVELLEDCLEDIGPIPARSYFTIPKLLLGSSAGSGCYFVARSAASPKWVYPIISGLVALYGSCCALKYLNRCRLRKQTRQLTRLIHSLEQFELAVKKNLLFLNESQHVRAVQVALNKSDVDGDLIARNCVVSCVAIVRAIHASVQQLERDFELVGKWKELYSPMEALEDCELFADGAVNGPNDVRAIKDYYNIFAYIQSQYLTRIGLSVACGLSNLSFCNLAGLVKKIDQERELCMRYLKKITDSNRERVPRVSPKTLPTELAALRTLTMNVSAKLLGTVHRYNQMEQSLESILSDYKSDDSASSQQLQALELPVEQIFNDLLASADECQRLQITLKKLLNKDGDSPVEHQPSPEENHDQEIDLLPSKEQVYSEQYKPLIKDEFFAVDGTEQDQNQEDDDRRSLVDDLESINSKIVKRHFKPVLAQLREKIEPIGVDFKEREKRALKDKGIEVEEPGSEEEVEMERANYKRTLYGSDSEDDQEEEERNAIKLQRSVQRYDEIRGFLATKEQVNIFGLKPMVSLVDEEVLE